MMYLDARVVPLHPGSSVFRQAPRLGAAHRHVRKFRAFATGRAADLDLDPTTAPTRQRLRHRHHIQAMGAGGRGQNDAAIGGARRDEESPAKNASFPPHASARDPMYGPNCGRLSMRLAPGESMRVFPLSTELSDMR